ncbi:uncharacterized protein LOC111627176 [Centruroides sculpturatus]|uniref:uncharacterized protein LOC111627176 n=1 Tax=Centruroides sculpturatus TaxID=218467 RepID=UPI000C6E9005|nr:uncharacterized protein LOC111627176 [Centruroides sculpturatus]
MSRVGNRILTVPDQTEVLIRGTSVEIKGKLGTLTLEHSPLIAVSLNQNLLVTSRANEEKSTKQLHGTTNSLIKSMLDGVNQGFRKEIEIKGVGYRASLQGSKLTLSVGYSHPIVLDVFPDVKVEVPKPSIVIVSGIDKQRVGQMAAIIRQVRRPNPYSGKGIMYKDEKIRRKEGKTASK